MKITRYVASNNSHSRRVRRAWEAVYFVVLVLSVCLAVIAVCGAIATGGIKENL